MSAHAPRRIAAIRAAVILAIAIAVCAATAPTVASAKAKVPRNAPPPSFPAGCDPGALRGRLASVDSADISRACGNISAPWAYRGPLGRHMSMQSYGRHRADRAWSQAMAEAILQDATIDSAVKMPSIQVACDPQAASPLYLVRFYSDDSSTFALLRFDLGAVLLFDAEEPLGMIAMDARADRLWAALAERLDDDPLLRGPRPAPDSAVSPVHLHGDYASVDELPEVLGRVPPEFPVAARVAGIDGLVLVKAKVGADGAVRDAFVVSGPPLLRDPALEAIWRWKFKPAFNGGKPVAVWVAIPVRFTLH